MSYSDILQDCLERLRQGATIESLVAEHPDIAEQLRADLSTTQGFRSLTSDLGPPTPTAEQAFRTNLAAEREKRRTKERGGFWSGFRAPALGLAAASLVAVLVVAALAGGFLRGQTAEASAIEGVVVENANGVLTVQTEDGLQSIEVDSGLTVNDGTGASVNVGSLEPGQYLVIRGQQRASRVFVARRIDLRATEALQTWCERNDHQCVDLEREIAQRASECSRDPSVCQAIRTRLQLLRNQIDTASRLRELRDRCDAGAAIACREVQQTCDNRPAACEAIRDWLRSRPLR